MDTIEAINILANLKRYISGGGVVDRKASEAINMAIRALEATADHDTVSKQAVIENVCTMLRNCFDASDEMIESVKITVGELPPSPSRPQELHWIPCSERLPGQEQRVLINLSDGDTSVGWLLRGNIWFTDYSYGKPEDEVVAWMPLPEPYAGRRTDE